MSNMPIISQIPGTSTLENKTQSSGKNAHSPLSKLREAFLKLMSRTVEFLKTSFQEFKKIPPKVAWLAVGFAFFVILMAMLFAYILTKIL